MRPAVLFRTPLAVPRCALIFLSCWREDACRSPLRIPIFTYVAITFCGDPRLPCDFVWSRNCPCPAPPRAWRPRMSCGKQPGCALAHTLLPPSGRSPGAQAGPGCPCPHPCPPLRPSREHATPRRSDPPPPSSQSPRHPAPHWANARPPCPSPPPPPPPAQSGSLCEARGRTPPLRLRSAELRGGPTRCPPPPRLPAVLVQPVA